MNHVNRIFAVIFLALLCVPGLSYAEIVPKNKQCVVTTPNKQLKILTVDVLESSAFRRAGGMPAYYPISPKLENKFLVVKLSAEFPAAPEGHKWELFEFYLQEPQKTDKIISPIGFSFRYDSFYKMDSGAAGWLEGENNMATLDNDLGLPGQFYYIKKGGWPGGRVDIKFLFEIPTHITKIELNRGSIIKAKTALPSSSPSGRTSPPTGATTGSEQDSSEHSKAAEWPTLKGDLQGKLELRISNPNEFSVKVALRSGEKGKDFSVSPNANASVYVPKGRYDVYFEYSNEPDSLYRGETVTIENLGVEIRIVKINDGNYLIQKVR